MLMLIAASSFAQNVSDILEKSLSGVVTVAVTESEDDEVLLGVKGNDSNIAYEQALDLSGFNSCGSGFIIEQNGKST